MSTARVLALCLGLFFFLHPVVQSAEQQQPQENIWESEWEAQEAQRSEAFARRILEAIRERDPQRAEELRKLYNEKPDDFWEEMRREFRERQREGAPQGPPPKPSDDRRGQRGGDDRGDRPDRDDPARRWEERLQRRHDEFVQWLEKNDPDRAAELAQLKEKNLDEYLNKSHELRRRYEPILRAEQDNPELARAMMQDLSLQDQRDDLLRRLRTAESGEKDALTRELQKVISARFDLIILKKQLMYDELYKRLQKLQQELEKRQSELEDLKNTKENNVQERLKELTTQKEKINWN